MTARIREAQVGDAAAIAAVYRPYVESTVISFEVVAPDRREMTRRIKETLEVYPWLVCEVAGQVVGYAYATKHRERAAYRWSMDTSVYVSKTYWRCGIGRGLYTSLLQILAAQGFVNAHAGITLPNPASVALHESVGFKPIGLYPRVGYKFGEWHDVGWWQLVLKEHATAPSEPLDLEESRRYPGWGSLVTRGQSLIRI